MRKILSLAAAVASVFAMGSAHADFLLVDSFNVPVVQQGDGDTSANGLYQTLFVTPSNPTGLYTGLGSQIATSRLIEQNLINANLDPTSVLQTSVNIGGGPTGRLSVGQQTADSTVRVTWDISSFTLPAAQSAILFQVLFSNVGTPAAPIKLDFEFRDSGNALQWTKNVTVGSLLNSGEQFGLLASEASSFAAGGKLQLVMSGTAGWDFVIDEFNIAIPEPTSLALVGLALVGAGIASRRRKA